MSAWLSVTGRFARSPPATAGGTDYQAYYDTDLNITWVADGNLAPTHDFGVSGMGTSTSGFGAMGWDTSQAWIAAMNTAGYLGVSDWRHTRVVDTDGPDPDALGDDGCNLAYSGTDCGWNVDPATGEIAHLYYVTLGNIGGYDPAGVHQDWCDTGLPAPPACLTNVGPFSNFFPNHYWTGTEFAPDVTKAWEFNARIGLQNIAVKTRISYVWPVRDGDIALLPVQAMADSVTTGINTPVPIAIVQNDLGLVDPVAVGIVASAANGTLTVNGSPGPQASVSVTYAPTPEFVGPDSFVYSVASISGTDDATVSIEVTALDADSDDDAVPDASDNCTLVANPTQLDADSDGYGNLCDADINDSGLTTSTDFNLLRGCINQAGYPTGTATCQAADMNGSGLVTSTDFNLLRARINTAPGPSGLQP